MHAAEHAGRLETISLDRLNARRHRLRAITDRGTDVAIALEADQGLGDGAVLYLGEDRAIVVRLLEQPWLVVAPRDAAAALELGYQAGTLHWRVRFAGEFLAVAMEGPEQSYRDRLERLLATGRARLVSRE